MSKSDGLKIGIRFTEDLIGDYATPEGGYEELKYDNSSIKSIAYSNQYSSTYSASKAFDDSTSTYWRTDSLPVWIQIELNNPIALTKFRWYIGNSTYYPKGFILEGSDNGIDFIPVFIGTSSSGTGWKDFILSNSAKYLFYRWTVTSRNSSCIYIYEFELFYKNFINESAFSITGQEYKYVHGNLIDKVYVIEKIEPHPTEPKSILITLDWWNRFNNVEDKIKVLYDASKGSLTGAGGAVESFEIEFTPQDLIQTPNPNEEETIKANPYEIILDLKEVDIINVIPEETIKAYPYEIVLNLINVDEINP